MQVSPAFHSISAALVSQRPGRLAASFQLSIHGTDARASAALLNARPWLFGRFHAKRNTVIFVAGSAGWEACTTNQAECLKCVPMAWQIIL